MGIRIVKTCFLAACLLTGFSDTALSTEPEPRKAILITGANSGIGRNIAERLATEGYFVYAGARKQEDINALSKIDNMQGVRLDVTIQADIDAAVGFVKAEGRGLYAVVNNAVSSCWDCFRKRISRNSSSCLT